MECYYNDKTKGGHQIGGRLIFWPKGDISPKEDVMKKKLLATLLACTMVVSLAACGSTGTTEAPAAESEETAEEAPAAEENEATEETAAPAETGALTGTLNLGFIGPLTGGAAIYGNAAANGKDDTPATAGPVDARYFLCLAVLLAGIAFLVYSVAVVV